MLKESLEWLEESADSPLEPSVKLRVASAKIRIKQLEELAARFPDEAEEINRYVAKAKAELAELRLLGLEKAGEGRRVSVPTGNKN